MGYRDTYFQFLLGFNEIGDAILLFNAKYGFQFLLGFNLRLYCSAIGFSLLTFNSFLDLTT